MFACLANLHSIENWQLVCLVGTKLLFLGGRKYSLISDRIILCKNLQFHYGDRVQVMHLHCGDIELQYMW